AHVKLSSSAVQISSDGTSAILTQGGERLWVKILAGPAGAQLSLMSAAALSTSPHPTGQWSTGSYKKLAIHLTGVTDARLAVLFVPLAPGQDPPTTLPAIAPLTNWGRFLSPQPYNFDKLGAYRP